MEDGCSEECLLSGNLGACQPTMSSSSSPSLQLEPIMFLAATVNESKSSIWRVGLSLPGRSATLPSVAPKRVQDVEQIKPNVGWVGL